MATNDRSFGRKRSSPDGERRTLLGTIHMLPPEVKRTVAAINEFRSQNETLAVDVAINAALALARNAKRTVYTVRIEQVKPEHLALMLITDVTGKLLQSSSYHVNRGVLSIVGKDQRTLWVRAISEMRERGYCTETKANDDLGWILKQIKEGG